MLKPSILFFCFFLAITFAFSQSTVAQFNIEGNKRLKTSFIKKMVLMDQKAVLDSLVLEKDIKRLKMLPAVANASYKVTTSSNNQVNVTYIIEEKFTTIPSANVYTSYDEEFAYRLGLYEFNLLGRSMMLGGFYQKDIYDSYGINFRAPHIFNRKLGFAINHQNLTLLEPAFFNDATINYKYNNVSYEIMGLYEVNFKNRVEGGINYFTEDYQYKSGKITDDTPLHLTIEKLLYKFIYEYNAIEYNYQYLSGIRSIFNFQYVISLNEDFSDFVIGWNDFLYYKRVGTKGNWANRLRIGFATNNDSPFAPFSVDNNLNIRGVGNTIDRGTGTIVLNTEYRHTLFERKLFVLQSNVFIDAGTWRNPGGGLNDFSDSDNIRIFPGFGFRFIHKKIYNAIFRIDYGYGITKNATQGLVFGIGQYF